MAASFMNPHDICDWIRQHPGARRHESPDRYPPAPANMAADPLEPEAVQYHRRAGYDLMSKAVGIAAEWRRDDCVSICMITTAWWKLWTPASEGCWGR